MRSWRRSSLPAGLCSSQSGIRSPGAQLGLPLLLHHRPIATAVYVEPHPEHGARAGVGPRVGSDIRGVIALLADVAPGRLRHLPGPQQRNRLLLALVGIEHAFVGPAAQVPGKTPAQVRAVEQPGIDPERPHRRDEVGSVAHEEHAFSTPLIGDAVMDLVGHLADHAYVLCLADERQDLVAQLFGGRLFPAGRERKKESPAVRMPHQDHPFVRIGKIGEVRVIPGICDIEVDLEVDE